MENHWTNGAIPTGLDLWIDFESRKPFWMRSKKSTTTASSTVTSNLRVRARVFYTVERLFRDDMAVRARCADLLLKSKENDHDIKLADFGFAKQTESRSLDTQCGTPGYERSLSLQRRGRVRELCRGARRYVAPEIIKGHKYGYEVDMWSCGVIVYILLGG